MVKGLKLPSGLSVVAEVRCSGSGLEQVTGPVLLETNAEFLLDRKVEIADSLLSVLVKGTTKVVVTNHLESLAMPIICI